MEGAYSKGASSPPHVSARFVKHNRQAPSAPSAELVDGLPFTPSHDTTNFDDNSTQDSTTIYTADVTDELPWVADTIPATRSSLIRRRVPDSALLDSETQSLLLKDNHTYPPDDNTFVPSSTRKASSKSEEWRRPRGRALGPHTPIPAVTVLSRGAAPLYLPQLDEYLSNLPAPTFSPVPSRGTARDNDVGIFPPMDLLVASKKTLEDLEANSTIPPWWRDRKTVLGAIANAFMAVMGSSALASFYSLQGLFNTVQIFALLLSTIVPPLNSNASSDWRFVFLGKIPNILALNFASTLVQSIIFLMIYMIIAALLLYVFYRSTSRIRASAAMEGLQGHETNKRWGLVIATFLLTAIYLPLSTMALHVMVWSDDLWVVPNPYINSTGLSPVLPPLGPTDEFRDPLDFCWTTTMKLNDVNYAPVIIIVAIFTFATLTIWFPIRLRQAIVQATPIVDLYTELGKPRSNSELDREYQRLMGRDNNPFAFLYKGFRRGWGTYESTYLIFKLSTLLLVALVSPDNCLFRTLSRTHLAVIRQVLILITMCAFLLVQCFIGPFVDPVNNASEFTSRINYVATSALSLGVALDIPGQSLLTGPLLYGVYIITYGLSAYFTIIDKSFMRNIVKKLTHRMDFSIDIFSPRLDIAPSSLHTRRRIWQEAISTLLLTSPECKIPIKQTMTFAQAPDSQYPPYLLNFADSPAERHVENLKILQEVGIDAYQQAVALLYGPDFAWYKHLAEKIQRQFIGPDCYWKDPVLQSKPSNTKHFGNAWWIPFPPTLVLRSDDGPLFVLRDVNEIESYIAQNSDPAVQKKRQIRMALRALDGQTVYWPYTYLKPVGTNSRWCCGGRKYHARDSKHYETAVFSIKRKGDLVYQGVQLGSGLQVQLKYDRGVLVDGGVIGLDDDYDLTPSLARFFALNERLIPHKLEELEKVLEIYRHNHIQEFKAKADVLSYRFLAFVYNQPRDPIGLAESSIEAERDLRVRQLMVGSEAIFEITYERLAAVTTTEAATWWYIFWDDLWRRNNVSIKALQIHAPDFDPHYPTSIAYHPIPRPALEAFLAQRGLLNKVPKWSDFFHSGLLNTIYLRLNDIVNHGTRKEVLFHLGDDPYEVDMEQVDFDATAGPSTLGTGGGTDHDDGSIRARPAYRWEGLLGDPLRKDKRWRRRWFAKMGSWFGLTPLWRSGMPSNGLSLDVQLVNGRYVLIEE